MASSEANAVERVRRSQIYDDIEAILAGHNESNSDVLVDELSKIHSVTDGKGQLMGIHVLVDWPIASVDVISKCVELCPQIASVKDSLGRLPLHYAAKCGPIDVIRVLIQAYPPGVGHVDSFGLLPLHYALVGDNFSGPKGSNGVAFGFKEDTVLELLVAYPEALLVESPYYKHPIKALTQGINHRDKAERATTMELNLLCVVARRYIQSRHVKVTTVNIHVCGEPNSGKSVLTHWVEDILKSRFNVKNLLHWHSSYTIPQGPQRHTRGIDTKCVFYNSADEKLFPSINFLVHDYGGQSEFKVNHWSTLCNPGSIYIIVLPMYDMENKVINDPDTVYGHLLQWLRYIYSVMFRTCGFNDASTEGTIRRSLIVVSF